MKKNEKRYHKTIGGKVASVYINEVYASNKPVTFVGNGLRSAYRDKYTNETWLTTSTIKTYYYEYIGACVSNSRRFNNDWWNGDKNGDVVYNKSTGNIRTLMAIVDILENHIISFIDTYGYYICEFEGTDKHRNDTYRRMVHKMTHKYGLTYRAIESDNDGYVYVIAHTLEDVLNFYS